MSETPQHHIEDAYYSGLRMGGDPEVLEDLGIPTSPERVAEHLESAQRVLEAPASIVAQAAEATYPSQLRELRQQVVKGIVGRTLTPAQVEGAFTVLKRRHDELTDTQSTSDKNQR